MEGSAYYLAKKQPVAGYEFQIWWIIFTCHAFGGIDYKPAIPINISFNCRPGDEYL